MIPSGPVGEHLFTIVFGPALVDGHGPDPQIMLVGFTSIKPNISHDPACEIASGEHPQTAAAIFQRNCKKDVKSPLD